MALLGVASINALLALIVGRAARRAENRVFAGVALSIALWTLTNALFRSASTTQIATLWAQLSYFAALSTGATFLHFAWVYPHHQLSDAVRTRKLAIYGLTLYGIGSLIAASTFVPGFVVRGIDLEQRSILTAPGLYPLAGFMVVSLGLAFWRLLHSQHRLRGRSRAQARYVLYGCALTAALGLVFNLFLPLSNDYRWVWVGPLSSLFFVGFSAYSIVAHRLFDVRLLIRRTLVYTLLLAALAGAFAVLEKGLEHVLRPLLGGDSFPTQLIAALLVGFALDPLKRQLHHLVGSRLFQGEPDGEQNGGAREYGAD